MRISEVTEMFIISEIVALLTTNLILTQALGTSTLFIAAGSRKNLLWTAVSISVFTTIGSFGACLLDSMLPDSLYDLKMLFYVLIIGMLYIISLTVLYFADRKDFGTTRKYIHVSAFNCAVMGTLFTISENAEAANLTMLDYICAGAEAGAGFILAAFVFTAAFKSLNSENVPSSFRGFPAALIYLGIISMAIYALM